MRLDYHPEAHAEFDAAASYYAERDPGLSARLVAAVDEVISQACAAPQRFPLLPGSGMVRRVLVGDKFPFAVLYAVRDEGILILAVMHCSREPGYWKRRSPGKSASH